MLRQLAARLGSGVAQQAAAPDRSASPTVLSPTGPKIRAGYMRESGAQVFTGFRPVLRETRDDVRQAWRDAAARATDLSQNSGFLAGGIEQAASFIIGTGLNLNAVPDASAIGMTDGEAQAWGRDVERKWEAYAGQAYEVDGEGRQTLHQQAYSAVRAWHATGEILGLFPYEERPGGRFGSKFRLLPAQRLLQDTGQGRFQGVRLSPGGMPTAYLIDRRRGVAGLEVLDKVEIAARDRFGRRRVLHVFDGLPGQVRGLSPLTPVLRVARQYDQLADATLTAAIIQAIMVGAITSDLPTGETLEAFKAFNEKDAALAENGILGYEAARSGHHGGANIDIGRFGKIAHLFTGEKFEFHGSKHPNDTYEAFAKFLLREQARCLGLTVEDLTGDYTNATYSSVRAAVAAMWLVILVRRSFIGAPVYQAVYENWLEEAIDSGLVAAPGGIEAFLANRAAFARARWRGQGRPQPDDLKTAKAQQIWKAMGVMTDEAIANELGADLEDVYEQLERERRMREERGLPDTALAGVNGDLLRDEPAEAPADA